MSEALVDGGVVSDGGTAALRRLLAGYAFASVAVGTTGVGVAVVLFDRSGSTAWATAGAVARVAPFVALGALAGLVAGRLPARRTLLVAAAAQVVAAMALLVTAGSAPLAIVACVSVVAHVAWTVAYPSIVSLVPHLVPAASIVTANGWLATLEALAWIVGPGVGGVVIAAAGVEAAAAMALGCGVIAVACLAPGAATRSAAGDGSTGPVELDTNDRSGASVRPGATAASTGSGVKDTLAVLRDGARLVTGNRSTLGAVTLHLLADLIAGAVAVLLIVVAAERLGFEDGGYGVLSAAAAAGSFGALVLVRRLAGVTRPWSLLAVAVLTSGAPIAVLAVVDAPGPALVLVAVSGLGGVMAEVMALTTVQRTVPERSIAQVIGLLDTVSIGAFVVGTLVAGPLVELVGLDVALVAVGAIVPAAGVLVAPWLLRGAERGDRLVLLPGAQLIAGVSVVSLLYARPDAAAASDPGGADGPEPVGAPAPPDAAEPATDHIPSGSPDSSRSGEISAAATHVGARAGAEPPRPVVPDGRTTGAAAADADMGAAAAVASGAALAATMERPQPSTDRPEPAAGPATPAQQVVDDITTVREPAATMSVDEVPVDEVPVDVVPVEQVPVGAAPVDEVPVDEVPAISVVDDVTGVLAAPSLPVGEPDAGSPVGTDPITTSAPDGDLTDDADDADDADGSDVPDDGEVAGIDRANVDAIAAPAPPDPVPFGTDDAVVLGDPGGIDGDGHVDGVGHHGDHRHRGHDVDPGRLGDPDDEWIDET